MPVRWQRERTPGWRKPEGAIYVGRGQHRYAHWGNPFSKSDPDCFTKYERHVRDEIAAGRLDLEELRGARYLMCWCPRGTPCHVDVLLKILMEKLDVTKQA